MAFARGKFGIEYNTAPRREEPGPIVPILVSLVFAAALISLGWTIYGRLKGDGSEQAQIAAADEEVRREEKAAEVSQAKEAEKTVELKGVAAVAAPVQTVHTPSAPPTVKDRPLQVRNLLKRLEEAEKKHDVEMAVTTIEQLRGLPGKPAADLDDAFAKRLGSLNIQRLFKMRIPLWTITVAVGRGDSASRIAVEHGSTFSSLQKLNPGMDLNRVKIGQKLKVMNHPTFRLLVTRSSKTADLLLNGKFFKRYYLAGPVTGALGTYELPECARPFWSSVGMSLSKSDRDELCTLLPKGTSVVLSDY